MNKLIQFPIHFLFATLFLLPLTLWAKERTSIYYPTNLPPSVQLHYQIKAHRNGLALPGEADVDWVISGAPSHQTYSINTETRAILFGTILQASSNGAIDRYGLAPAQYEEKPRNKPTIHTEFNREKKVITFSESKETYAIKGGEQDRSSVLWQLVSMARAAPKKFVPNSQWTLFVAGRRDAEKWIFTVADIVTISTPLGNLVTTHLIKTPPPDSEDQHLDIWLAPGKEWYPVRIKFTDAKGDTIDQHLNRITNKLGVNPTDKDDHE